MSDLIESQSLLSNIRKEFIGLDVESQKILANKIEADIYRKSLFKFAKYCVGYSEITEGAHGDMIHLLESDKIRKMIVMPRGTFKSSIGVVAYSIWKLIRNPNERILIDSELYTNSKNFMFEIKAHLESERFTDLFGEFKTKERWTQGEIVIAQRTKKELKEASITAGGVGTIKVGQHYTTIIGDDYNSFKNSANQEQRAKVIQHYRSNQAILEPGGEYVIIGTRYAQDDVIGHIIASEVE